MRKFLPLLLLFFLFGCNQENGEPNAAFKDSLPGSNGGRLDVIVVAEDGLYSDVAGESLRRYFTRARTGLPQEEPVFNLRQVDPKEFNDLLKRTRNLILLETGESKFEIRKNVYARPQRVVRFSAPDEEALAKLINENHKKAEQSIMALELSYLRQRLTRKTQPLPAALKNHHATMAIPADYELENESEDLLVFWKKGVQSDMGIMVHFEPIDDEASLLGEKIIPLRDSLTQIYVPGENEGSYMVVEDMMTPSIENTEIDGHFALETRGLWRVTNDFMGGSFINFTIFDEDNNQRIMLDGFVYAPELSKRNLILELEAILRSFETTN